MRFIGRGAFHLETIFRPIRKSGLMATGLALCHRFLNDPERGLLYIGRAMYTEAQIRYVEEVLGVSASYLTQAPPPSSTIPLAVQTLELSGGEMALLKKILASANISAYQLFASKEIPLGCVQVINFTGAASAGRAQVGATTTWNLPKVADMMGAGPEVTEAKRVAWNLLQQFMRESGQGASR